MNSTFHTKTENVTAAIARGARGAADSPVTAFAGLDDGSLAVRCMR
ncbi:MAG TPA: hypothetical protein VMV16_04420 [Solirubrobacteraceae bacterium]|nr:hypothetical protein [Solirubrobacteraceae bacterium]